MSAQFTTAEALRAAIASTIACSVQELQEAIGQVVVATAAECPAAGPDDRSLSDPATRTLVLLADRIPAGQEAMALAAAIELHHGRQAAQAVLGGERKGQGDVSNNGGAPDLVVDGLDESACFAGDGDRSPFVIFDVDHQENIAGPFWSRDQADQHHKEILAGHPPRLDVAALSQALAAVEDGDLRKGKVSLMTDSEIRQHVRKLQAYGAKVSGDKVTLYRGADVSIENIKRLRYGDYLSATHGGSDATGNEGAAGYGENVVRFELPVQDVIVTGAGEYQFKGKSLSLDGGIKYPDAVYRAYNDAYGANYTAKEIDAQDNVRVVASQALAGGREEFDELVSKHMRVRNKADSPSP